MQALLNLTVSSGDMEEMMEEFLLNTGSTIEEAGLPREAASSPRNTPGNVPFAR